MWRSSLKSMGTRIQVNLMMGVGENHSLAFIKAADIYRLEILKKAD